MMDFGSFEEFYPPHFHLRPPPPPPKLQPHYCHFSQPSTTSPLRWGTHYNCNPCATEEEYEIAQCLI